MKCEVPVHPFRVEDLPYLGYELFDPVLPVDEVGCHSQVNFLYLIKLFQYSAFHKVFNPFCLGFWRVFLAVETWDPCPQSSLFASRIDSLATNSPYLGPSCSLCSPTDLVSLSYLRTVWFCLCRSRGTDVQPSLLSHNWDSRYVFRSSLGSKTLAVLFRRNLCVVWILDSFRGF